MLSKTACGSMALLRTCYCMICKVCYKTWLDACVQLKLTDVQNGAEILVDDFDPEAHAQQTLAQKAEDARHHAARMLRQSKVHNPDASSFLLMTNINISYFESCKLCMLQGKLNRLACSLCIRNM